MNATEEDWAAELARKASTSAEGWKPEKGEVIVGTVIDVEFFTGEYGTYPIITVETTDGQEVNIHGFHTVLKNEIVKKRPQAGDKIAVAYHGKKEGKRGGAAYESYALRLKREEGQDPTPWDEMEAESHQEMQKAGIDSQVEATTPPTGQGDDIPF